MEKDNINILFEKIPRGGMSKGCQKIFSHIAKHYFDPKSDNNSLYKLGKKNQGYAQEIYKRLDLIKLHSLKKASQIMNGRHPKDLEEDYVFVDTIIRYCVDFTHKKKGLTRKLAKSVGVKQTFLKKEKSHEDKKELSKIAKNPSFYTFLLDNVLDK